MQIEFKKNTNIEQIYNAISIILELNIKFELLTFDDIYTVELKDKLDESIFEKIKDNDCISKIYESKIKYMYSREFNDQDSIIKVNDLNIGNNFFNVIAGPCCIESYDQLLTIAKSIKASGANLLRAGAFKPRSSPYSFQGLQKQGLEILISVKKEINIPVVSEIVNLDHLELFEDVDIIQIGARNMQNFELLKAVGKSKKIVLLKRGFSNTIEEFLLSAEYIMKNGNENIILCERGIRSFCDITRNKLDISSIPIIKRLSHLPIIADPSHACGLDYLIAPLSLASIACGADGLMIEVHNSPKCSVSDSAQALSCNMFEEHMKSILNLSKFFNKSN